MILVEDYNNIELFGQTMQQNFMFSNNGGMPGGQQSVHMSNGNGGQGMFISNGPNGQNVMMSNGGSGQNMMMSGQNGTQFMSNGSNGQFMGSNSHNPPTSQQNSHRHSNNNRNSNNNFNNSNNRPRNFNQTHNQVHQFQPQPMMPNMGQQMGSFGASMNSQMQQMAMNMNSQMQMMNQNMSNQMQQMSMVMSNANNGMQSSHPNHNGFANFNGRSNISVNVNGPGCYSMNQQSRLDPDGNQITDTVVRERVVDANGDIQIRNRRDETRYRDGAEVQNTYEQNHTIPREQNPNND